MWQGWTRAPTGRERKTCGPSSNFHHEFRRRSGRNAGDPACPELAHFPHLWKAACAGKSVQKVVQDASWASSRMVELRDHKVDKGLDARRAVAARDGQRMDRKRLGDVALLQQRH